MALLGVMMVLAFTPLLLPITSNLLACHHIVAAGFWALSQLQHILGDGLE